MLTDIGLIKVSLIMVMVGYENGVSLFHSLCLYLASKLFWGHRREENILLVLTMTHSDF